MTRKEEVLFELLEAKYRQFSRLDFIADDPISIPHLFTKKEDIEIAGFLAAVIAWGQRVTVIKNSHRLISIMDGAPFDFILHHTKKDLEKAQGFVHRTFNSIDLKYFFTALQHIYKKEGGLEAAFCNLKSGSENQISNFKQLFFSLEHERRTQKHLADPLRGSTAKRINMYLRWMVRSNKEGVDFGIWKELSPKDLMLPLDVHTGNVGRKLGLLKRKQNDWKAVEEITKKLRKFDPLDPVKYDFALFGMGVNKDIPT